MLDEYIAETSVELGIDLPSDGASRWAEAMRERDEARWQRAMERVRPMLSAAMQAVQDAHMIVTSTPSSPTEQRWLRDRFLLEGGSVIVGPDNYLEFLPPDEDAGPGDDGGDIARGPAAEA